VRGELGAEERDEVRVHGGVVVGHAGYDEGLVGEFGGETVGHPGGVFRAGRAGRVVRRGVEQGLGPGGEPPVARAEEEAFGFHRGSGRGGETKKIPPLTRRAALGERAETGSRSDRASFCPLR